MVEVKKFKHAQPFARDSVRHQMAPFCKKIIFSLYSKWNNPSNG